MPSHRVLSMILAGKITAGVGAALFVLVMVLQAVSPSMANAFAPVAWIVVLVGAGIWFAGKMNETEKRQGDEPYGS